jgi:hypothetical protein
VCEVEKRHQSAGPTVPYYRVAFVNRQCSRTGCAELAVVTLSYDYGQAQAWLDALSVERDPHCYDLCERHGARVSVPQGWVLRDRRPLTAWPVAV